MSSQDVIIAGAARTPFGRRNGGLSALPAPRLGAIAIKAAIVRSGVGPEQVDQTLMGCVLPAGLGQAPARQAALGAGVPMATACATVNKVCGSGMFSAMLAADMIAAGSATTVVAGGMESMSRAPGLSAAAGGAGAANESVAIGHMLYDGLTDAYENGRLMGNCAEESARDFGFARHVQDDYAVRSLDRALEAARLGAFKSEIVPVPIDEDVSVPFDADEQPDPTKRARIPTLKPAFGDGGTITAANASSISDGAAALVLTTSQEAARWGAAPLGVIRGHAAFAHIPAQFAAAPVGAIRELLRKVEWRIEDVDLFEINEAFAVVVLIAIAELGLPPERVNVQGGALALGHPIGASGARIVVSLLNSLKRHNLRRGIAAVCIGGGEATAIAVERVSS